MRLATYLLGLLLVFVLLTSVQAEEEEFREFSDPLLNKLTNFLPDYTPFIPPLPPDRYFPDAVGKRIANAIVDAYLQDPEAVEAHVRALAQHDAELINQGERPTGLTAYVQSLASRPQLPATRDDAAEEIDELDAAELDTSSDELLAQADQLLADEKRSRVARMFNWVLSTFDVGSLFLGTPRSPSPYSAQGVVSTLTNSDDAPSPRERKALVLYKEFLYRAPKHERATQVRETVDALEARRKQALLQAELERAKAAFAKRDYWSANFHYQLALMIDEESVDAHTGIRQVEARLQQLVPLEEHEPQDPYDRVRDAKWEYQKETLKYVMPGSSFVKDNFVVAGVQVATEGLVGAATFGALSVIQLGGKLWQVMTGNPVSQEAVITEAERYVHTTPPEKRTPEVYRVLAEAYQKEGKLDQAIAYYKLAGQEDTIPRLKEQAAQALLEQAKQTPHRGQKRAFLQKLAEDYPDTDAATLAAPALRKLSRRSRQGLQLTKSFLKEHPDLIGPQGLSLKPQLLDGDWDNVELADDGVTVLADQELALQLHTDDGPRTKVYRVPSAGWQQFWRRFRAEGFEQAAEHGDRQIARLLQGAEEADIALKSEQEKNEAARWRTLPYLAGSTSGTSIDFRGTLPKEVAGTRLAFGKDQRSAFVGMEVPMPFVPVDFLLLGRNGMPSLYPKVRLPDRGVKNEELYQ